MVSSCLQGEPRKKELVPAAGRMRVRYKGDRPDSEERRCLGRLWNALSWSPSCQGETCWGDENKGDFCLVLKELDQKFYYWSVLGGVSRKLRVLRFPRGEKNGITGRQRIYFSFKNKPSPGTPSGAGKRFLSSVLYPFY